MDIDPLSEPALLESAGKHEESKHDTSYDEESSDEVPIAKTIATSSKLSPHRARTEKDRRDPRATGALHEIPCRACAKKGVACQKEVRGGACVTCYKWKKRCTHSGAVREKRRKRKLKMEAALSDIVRQMKRPKKHIPYVEVTSDDSDDRTESAPQEAGNPCQAGPAPRELATPSRPKKHIPYVVITSDESDDRNELEDERPKTPTPQEPAATSQAGPATTSQAGPAHPTPATEKAAFSTAPVAASRRQLPRSLEESECAIVNPS
jgi:hypothetical protein